MPLSVEFKNSANRPSVKIFIILLASLILGFPLREFWSYLILILGTLLIVHSRPKKTKAISQLILLSAVGFLTLIRFLLPQVSIQEGHNVFLKTEEKNPYIGVMPELIYESLNAEFLAAYPESQQCNDGEPWCWKTIAIPEKLYAFSSDSFWQQNVKMSRKVDRINFDGLSDFKAGFIGDWNTSFFDSVSDVKRATMPYFVVWEVDTSMVGGVLKWSGDVWFENETGGFDHDPGKQKEIIVGNQMVGKHIWVSRIDPNKRLSVKFTPALLYRTWAFLNQGIALSSILLLIFGLREVNIRSFAIDTQIVFAGLAVLFLLDPHFIVGRSIIWGGSDGLWTEGFGFWSTQALKNGDIFNFLRSGENAFYLMPFLRYLRSFEDIFFGDTQYFMVSCALLILPGFYRILHLFMPKYHALVLVTIFSFMQWHLGFVRWGELARYGLSEPVAYMFMIPCIYLVLKQKHSSISVFWVPLCAAIAVGLRPNYLPVAALILVYFWSDSENLQKDGWIVSIVFCCVIALIPLHNWIFAHKFVPFTTGYNQVKPIEWTDWFIGLADLVRFNLDSEILVKIVIHLKEWLFNWPNFHWKIPQSPLLVSFFGYSNLAVFLFCLLSLFVNGSNRLRRLAIMGLLAQLVVLLFAPTGRYTFLAWDLCYLTVLLWTFRWVRRLFDRCDWVKPPLVLGRSFLVFYVLLGGIAGDIWFHQFAKNNTQLRFRLKSDSSSYADLFYANYYRFTASKRVAEMITSGAWQWVCFDIPRGYDSYRFDPTNADSGEIIISNAEIRYGNGRWKSISISSLQPKNNIKAMSEKGHFEVTGYDPIFMLAAVPSESFWDQLMSNRIWYLLIGGLVFAIIHELNYWLLCMDKRRLLAEMALGNEKAFEYLT